MSYWHERRDSLLNDLETAKAGDDQIWIEIIEHELNAHNLPTPVEYAQLPEFRSMVHLKDEDGLKHEFWLTLQEARHLLHCYDLATRPAWGAEELLEAVTIGISEEDRLAWGNMPREQIARYISLAQQSGQLPQVFRAKEGIAWAQHRVMMTPLDGTLSQAIERLASIYDGSLDEELTALEERNKAAEAARTQLLENSSQPFKRMVEWRKALVSNWPAMVGHYEGVPDARQVISYLKKRDIDGCILPGGMRNELRWRALNGEEKFVTYKTVANAITEMRGEGILKP